MAQVVAITEIVRNVKPGIAADKAKGTPAVKPVSKTIQPGTLFVSEGEELEFLRRARAVRDPEPGEFGAPKQVVHDDPVATAKSTSKPKKQKAEAKSDEPADDAGDDSGESLV